MKEFEVAAKRTEAEGDDKSTENRLEFKVRDKPIGDKPGKERVFHAFPPEPGQMAVLMSGLGRHTTMFDNMAAIIDFVDAVLDKPSATYLMQRLMDRDDPFEIEHIQKILEWMIEEWSGRPTESLSVSTQ